jgi:hypothetical protein
MVEVPTLRSAPTPIRAGVLCPGATGRQGRSSISRPNQFRLSKAWARVRTGLALALALALAQPWTELRRG